jgi:hypothetical protein|nr:MAG TPA: hypothetical protein [Caudoviricetes sp.]
MAKLTKFKEQKVEFPTHYLIENTTRGNNNIKSIVPEFGVIKEQGTLETAEVYNGLQLGNVHTLYATKTTALSIDYYTADIDGLNEFGLNNDLKIYLIADSTNENDSPKLRLNGVDYALLKEYDGELKNVFAKDIKPHRANILHYNGSQFIVSNIIVTATEEKQGVAKLYSNMEAETDIEKVKETIEKNTGNQKEYIEERMTTQEYERRVGQGETFEGEPRYGGDVDPGMVTVRKATGETVWTKLIKALDHSKILTVRGLIKFLSKLLKPAGENDYGLTTNNNIKNLINVHAPRPDLSPFIRYDKSFIHKGNNIAPGQDYFVRCNENSAFTPHIIDMYAGDNIANYTGSFHTNKGRAYYKVPQRAGGGWCEIMDNYDMTARDQRMNNMDADRTNLWNKANDTYNRTTDLYWRSDNDTVRDVRLVGFIELVRHNYGAVERGGYIVTGIKTQPSNQDFWVQMRALQVRRGGGGQNWYNTPFG